MNLRTHLILVLSLFFVVLWTNAEGQQDNGSTHRFNGPYSGAYLDRVAFPIGGIGAGMIALEGTGAISHVSVRHKMDFFNEPCMFAALSVKGVENGSKVLEGPVPKWKYFGRALTGRGSPKTSYGLPRFSEAAFTARFPFGNIQLDDPDVPLEVKITGWSPFIPRDPDNSSLPVGMLEYTFTNPTSGIVEAVFSYHSRNFMAMNRQAEIRPLENGFLLFQPGSEKNPEYEGYFGFFVEGDKATVDHCWFMGSHFDDFTLLWETIEKGLVRANPPCDGSAPGASLYVPFELGPGESKTIHLGIAWYVPHTTLCYGQDPPGITEEERGALLTHVPWYAGRFADFQELVSYWKKNIFSLRERTDKFSETFYQVSLPDEVIEAVAANLTILKSPTVLRQTDGRLWAFEGCSDDRGCCPGSCTHVWNYAQAIAHLFPSLERSLRQTEFNESQSEYGRQTFRATLPIRPASHDPADYLENRFAAADGQLGGIMKIHREWRISGDTEWLKGMWPKVKRSMDFCINTWDPRRKGIMDEPQHNTYDIQFWGPNGMIGSFYLGALKAMESMGDALGEDVKEYKDLYRKGKAILESELFNGEYFYQKVQTEGLNATFYPIDEDRNGEGYADVVRVLNSEGPKYQYGTGCLSDGVLGSWIARMCGLGEIIDPAKVQSHLLAVHKYNLKYDLTDHVNPQRPAYALGDEGGLLLCTWPRGGKITLPFIYSNEVWTGIEYQVASHLMLEGFVDEGLDIVRECRKRYDGRVRNPFNEYECGHWYARAMSSYGMIQGLTGIRYDAVTKTLYIDSRLGNDFSGFFSGETGYGNIGLRDGTPFVKMAEGNLEIKSCLVSGKKVPVSKIDFSH